jgi:hypothetical protein
MCVNATNPDWIVIYDGRIPNVVEIYLNTDLTTSAASSWTTLDLANFTTQKDNGSLVNIASDEIVIRRTGDYVCTLTMRQYANSNDGDVIGIGMDLKTGATTVMGDLMVAGGAYRHVCKALKTVQFSTGDDLECVWYSEKANTGWVGLRQYTTWTLSEQL